MPAAKVRTLSFPPILTRGEVDEIKAALASRRNTGRSLRGTEGDPYILRGLQIRGVVTHDPDGPYLIGKYRYAIEWGGLIDLERFSGSGVRKLVSFEGGCYARRESSPRDSTIGAVLPRRSPSDGLPR